MARAAPRIIPIAIDSNVNPGIGGIASGTEPKVEVEVGGLVLIVEDVLANEVTALDVLAMVVGCTTAVEVVEVCEVLLLVTVAV